MKLEVQPAKPRPCEDCLWRCDQSGEFLLAGQHPEFPDHTYEVERGRLWGILRNGGRYQTCHTTDTRYTPGHSRGQVFNCTGAAVLVMRELELLEREFGDDWAAYHRAHPDGLTTRGRTFWQHRRRVLPPEHHDVDLGQHVSRDSVRTSVQHPTVRMRCGDVGYCIPYERLDDCLRAAIATAIQVPPEEIPDPRLLERLWAGEDPDVISREGLELIEAWLLSRGLELVFHDHPFRPFVGASDRRRWVGVYREQKPLADADNPFSDHCLVMARGTILFDPAISHATPNRRVRRWRPSEIVYGLSFNQKE